MLAAAGVAAAGEGDARGCVRGGLAAAGEQERLLAAACLPSGKHRGAVPRERVIRAYRCIRRFL